MLRPAVLIIRNEHRSLAAVLHGLLYLVREVPDQGARPDFALFRAMIDYIDAFPERFHHPKEDAYLFRRLRQRGQEATATLDELEAQHVQGAELIRGLRRELASYEATPAAGVGAFANAVEAYANFHWQHMRKEEDVLLPLAERLLTEEDWREIDAAFQSNDNPLLGALPRQEFQQLFTRIVNLAPPPIGIGPEE